MFAVRFVALTGLLATYGRLEILIAAAMIALAMRH
jgi:hypothetical protein